MLEGDEVFYIDDARDFATGVGHEGEGLPLGLKREEGLLERRFFGKENR